MSIDWYLTMLLYRYIMEITRKGDGMDKTYELIELLCEALDHEGKAKKCRKEYRELYNSLDAEAKKVWKHSRSYKSIVETFEKKFKEDN